MKVKKKVEINETDAQKLIAAGVEIECHYYMYVENVITHFTEGSEKKKKKRSSPKNVRAPANCFFVLNPGKKSLSNMMGDLTPAFRGYVSTIIAYLMKDSKKDGATRQELGELLLKAHPRLEAGANPMGTAKTYVSKAYQMGIIVESK